MRGVSLGIIGVRCMLKLNSKDLDPDPPYRNRSLPFSENVFALSKSQHEIQSVLIFKLACFIEC